MTAEEYFGDWMKVIDKEELVRIMKWIKTLDPETLCPAPKNIFKAFRIHPLKDCRAFFIGQDPFPQKGVATGILFGNSEDTPDDRLSPSLEVIKEAAINYEIPHGPIWFDKTLESWAKQGILMINSALTCEVNKVGWHVNVWRPFMRKLIRNISRTDNGLLFVLFGRQAQELKPFIEGNQCIIEIEHPAYFARRKERMPSSVFTAINRFLKGQYNEQIEFYKDV